VNRPFVTFVTASAVFMTLVLLSDRDGLWAQLLLGLATAGFLIYFVRRSETDGRQVLCAVIVATAGEIVLSLGWGLYSYRHAIIPLYVPPGHGLFYLLAAETARQAGIRRYAAVINRTVLIGGSLIALISLAGFADAWGFLWWLGALALLQASRNRLLLSACFAFTILLEWFGTINGNWLWAPVVPYVGLHSANPPAGVGILYILLDLIVVLISSTFAPQISVAAAAPALTESSGSKTAPCSP
jgi:hypothetical protein